MSFEILMLPEAASSRALLRMARGVEMLLMVHRERLK